MLARRRKKPALYRGAIAVEDRRSPIASLILLTSEGPGSAAERIRSPESVNWILTPLIVAQTFVGSGCEITLISSADDRGAGTLKREMKC
jgi:hypothetical protein